MSEVQESKDGEPGEPGEENSSPPVNGPYGGGGGGGGGEIPGESEIPLRPSLSDIIAARKKAKEDNDAKEIKKAMDTAVAVAITPYKATLKPLMVTSAGVGFSLARIPGVNTLCDFANTMIGRIGISASQSFNSSMMRGFRLLQQVSITTGTLTHHVYTSLPPWLKGMLSGIIITSIGFAYKENIAEFIIRNKDSARRLLYDALCNTGMALDIAWGVAIDVIAQFTHDADEISEYRSTLSTLSIESNNESIKTYGKDIIEESIKLIPEDVSGEGGRGVDEEGGGGGGGGVDEEGGRIAAYERMISPSPIGDSQPDSQTESVILQDIENSLLNLKNNFDHEAINTFLTAEAAQEEEEELRLEAERSEALTKETKRREKEREEREKGGAKRRTRKPKKSTKRSTKRTRCKSRRSSRKLLWM